jgi:hypothetical protein
VGLYRAEQVIAERILRLANGKLPWPYIDSEKALPWIEQKTGLSLAESQVAAIRLALLSKVLVITGGPGVGKTTIVNSILRILAAKGVSLLLCAPTGRAAKRMTEATGFEAKTIHRLLEVDPKGGGFKRNTHNRLECDLLVIDETSMVDVLLMQALMRAVPDHAANKDCVESYRAGPASWCSSPSIAVPNFAQSPCCIAFRASSSRVLACSKAGCRVGGCDDPSRGCCVPKRSLSASSSVASITTLSPATAMTRFSCGKFVPSAVRYTGTTYRKESSIGVTISFPRITLDPFWSQRVSCWEMVVFWLIIASIWLGP